MLEGIMARRSQLSAEQLTRLKLIADLPPNAVLTTADAALYCGTGGSTWERLRSRGLAPPAIRVTARTLGYRKKDLDAHLDELREDEDRRAA
jgi:hypothetical protein